MNRSSDSVTSIARENAQKNILVAKVQLIDACSSMHLVNAIHILLLLCNRHMEQGLFSQ
jgi:hypothetical protein